MAGQSSVFPVYIRAEYDPSGRGLDSLAAEFRKAGDAGGRQYVAAASAQLDTLSAKVAQALSIPRNAGGSLDFSQTIAELKRAEQASEAFAAATREVASAQKSVLISNGAASREAANEVRLLNQLSREQEQNTATVRAQISVYEKLQAELNQTASATKQVVDVGGKGTTAFGALTNSARAMRQATVQAGQQFQDIAISIGSGQRASVVLAQQLPQLAFALSGVEGKTGAVARLFAGPWGVALALGAFALGPLIDGLFKSEKASDSATKAYQSQADKLSLLKNSFEQVLIASQAYNAEQDRSRELTLQSAEATAIQAAKNIEAAIAIRQKLAAELAATNQTAANSAGQGFGGFTSFNVGKGAGIESEIRANDQALKDLGITAKNAVIGVAEEMAKLTNDPKYKIEVGFKQLAEDARNSITDVKKLATALADIDKRKKARLDALKEDSRSSRSTGGSNGAPTTAEVSRILLKNFGGTITSTNKGKHTNGSDHYANQAVDFVPAGGVGAITKAQIEQALAYEGILIRISKKGKQLLGPGDKDHDDHFHVAFDKARGDPNNTGKAIEAAQKEAAAFQSEMDSLSVTIERISGQFDEQPRLIDRINVANLQMQKIVNKIDQDLKDTNLTQEQRVILEEKKTAAIAAQGVATAATDRPLRDMLKVAEERAAIDDLLLQNRGLEAQVLQRILQLQTDMNPLTEAQANRVTGIVLDEERRAQALEKQRDIQQQQLALFEQTGDNLRSTIADLLDGKGSKAFGNLISRQFQIVKESLTDKLFESLFGDVFRDQKLKILGLDKVDEAGKAMASRVTDTVNELERFKNALAGTTSAITGAIPANDNGGPADSGLSDAQIIVNGIKDRDSNLVQTLAGTLEKVFAINGGASKSIARAIEGGFEGAALGGFVGSAFGGKGGKIGQAAGGILGSVNGFLGANSPLKGIVSALPQVGAVLQASSALSSLLGNDQIKGGKILGPLSPILTALFGSSLRGSAVIGGKGGSLGVTRTTGNSGSRQSASTSNANTVIDQINSIAEQLGATVDASLGSVSIGIRKKQYLIDPTGQGRTKGSGVIKFGEGDEGQLAAARAAALDLINDGVIVGLRAGSQKLLANAKSLEEGLSKALKFQSVFDRLKQREDPLGFALDTIDREFTNLRNIFMEAGASASDLAALQKLYDFERVDAVKNANSEISASLKDFYNSLTAGNDARSLKERQEAALKEYDPLKARVAAGDKTAYDDFTQIAQQLLDIERQIYGSQSGYFTRLNEITDLTKTRVDADSNVSMINELRPGIFGSANPNNDTAPIVGAIMGGNANLLEALNLANSFNGQAITLLTQIAAANDGGRFNFNSQQQYY